MEFESGSVIHKPNQSKSENCSVIHPKKRQIGKSSSFEMAGIAATTSSCNPNSFVSHLGKRCGGRRRDKTPAQPTCLTEVMPEVVSPVAVESRMLRLIGKTFRFDWDERAWALVRNPSIYGVGARFFVLEYCLIQKGVLDGPPKILFGLDCDYFVEEIKKVKLPRTYMQRRGRFSDIKKALRVCRLELDGKPHPCSMTLGELRATFHDLIIQLWEEIERSHRRGNTLKAEMLRFPPLEAILRSQAAKIDAPPESRTFYILRPLRKVTHLRITVDPPTVTGTEMTQVCVQPAWGETLIAWKAKGWKPEEWTLSGEQATYVSPPTDPLNSNFVIGYWNVRGANTESFVPQARAFMEVFRIRVLICTETRVDMAMSNFLVAKTGMTAGVAASGSSTHGGCWVIWKEGEVEAMQLERGNHQLHAIVGLAPPRQAV